MLFHCASESRSAGARATDALFAIGPQTPGVRPDDGFALVRLDLDCGYLSESRVIAYFAARSDGEIVVAAHRADYVDGTPNRDCWTEHRILEVKHGELVIPVPRWK